MSLHALIGYGFLRSTFVRVQIGKQDRAMIAAIGGFSVPCAECEGRGVWDYAAPEVAAGPCVACKGTWATTVGG